MLIVTLRGFTEEQYQSCPVHWPYLRPAHLQHLLFIDVEIDTVQKNVILSFCFPTLAFRVKTDRKYMLNNSFF